MILHQITTEITFLLGFNCPHVVVPPLLMKHLYRTLTLTASEDYNASVSANIALFTIPCTWYLSALQDTKTSLTHPYIVTLTLSLTEP